MTDAEKVKVLRGALERCLRHGISDAIYRPAKEALASTATEPEKPWWDVDHDIVGLGLFVNGMPIDRYETIDRHRQFLRAAPLMAKALLRLFLDLPAHDNDGDYREWDKTLQQAGAALKAAGVEIPR
jgi:hypothetical protein